MAATFALMGEQRQSGVTLLNSCQLPAFLGVIRSFTANIGKIERIKRRMSPNGSCAEGRPRYDGGDLVGVAGPASSLSPPFCESRKPRRGSPEKPLRFARFVLTSSASPLQGTLVPLTCLRTLKGGVLIRFVLPIAIFLLTATSQDERKLVPPAVGAKVGDVTMKDVSGRTRTLSEFKNKKAIVVIFVGTECPIANLYFPTLAEMQRRYDDRGVQILAINSNDQDTFADVVAHAHERKLPFPICKDADQRAMEAFGARRTPEAFLLDGDRTIRYRGRIDDQYGYTYRRAVPTHTELKDALTELLAGKAVTVPESECQGCLIGHSKKDGSNNRVR